MCKKQRQRKVFQNKDNEEQFDHKLYTHQDFFQKSLDFSVKTQRDKNKDIFQE